MSAADKIQAARKLIEPLTKLHDAATPGDLSTAETTDEGEWFDCPHCNGTAEVQADQFINYDGVAANVLFSGVGIEFGANRDWYLAVCRDWPKVRDTVAALADLADAQAQDGWLYHCPDSGLEWSEDHPHESGQCTDATDVRPATVENLKATLLDSWEAWAEDRERADALAQENAKLKAIIAAMDGAAPRADKTCDEPGITLSEAVQRQWPDLRIGDAP